MWKNPLLTCCVLLLLALLNSCSGGRSFLADEDRSALLKGVPKAWAQEDAIILSDSLDVTFSNGLFGNSAVIRSVRWILVNEVRD